MRRLLCCLVGTLLMSACFAQKPQVLVHTMPWFQSKPYSKVWGWHWTMGKADIDPAKGQVASHYTPLIGPYDSGDPDALECQMLLMKGAGIDGIILDWYGLTDHYDYATNHANTLKLIALAKRFGLKFAICYEDQTIPILVRDKVIDAKDTVAQGKKELAWLKQNLFCDPLYLKSSGKPVLLVFGPQGFSDAEWTEILQGSGVAFYTELGRRDEAVGAFGWPVPGPKSGDELDAFYERSKSWPSVIAPAYPRFEDFYKQAGVGPGYGRIDDAKGQTLRSTLKRALASKAEFVQLVTWNDWGEGTQIEPSVQLGCRDLTLVGGILGSQWTEADYQMVIKLYQLRKSGKPRKALDRIASFIRLNKLSEARRQIAQLK